MLYVTVVDANDEAPRFNESIYQLSVVENSPSGTEVGRVVALDSDLSPNNRHTFSLNTTSELRELFRIDSLTGVISTRRRLDAETTDRYQLTALVTGSCQRASSASVVTGIVYDVGGAALR